MSVPEFSFEFFPPRSTTGWENLHASCKTLTLLRPDFVSVTFGAGGSTQDGTLEAVTEMRKRYGLDAAPHLSCIGSTTDSIRSLLNAYREAGVTRIVALRGDLPSGVVDAGEFRYANELVAFIRAEHGQHFQIEVAAYPEFHPQSRTPARDLENFVRKVEAGADAAITQYFFNSDAYFDLLERCHARGVTLPIVPGIMPITNYHQLARFSDACGAEIPRWIRRRLEAFGDDMDSLRAFGHEVVGNLCEKLLAGGAPGLHFYTLNRASPICALWEELGLSARR